MSRPVYFEQATPGEVPATCDNCEEPTSGEGRRFYHAGGMVLCEPCAIDAMEEE